ncbi:hypothetical protein ACFXKD_00540 [Nocardiopsis aegyptia]|uniref:hypothetical protein n=1 Tax=Nocardiopsis aegyptia TaxID=220378 RepID=UPI00367289A1
MRYLNPSALLAVRLMAEEATRLRRPRRANRARAYAPWPTLVTVDAVPVVVLRTVLDGLQRWEATR